MQINEFYPSNIPQSQASVYQGRPLSAAHGVNLNGTNNLINGNNNNNSNSNASLNTSSVQNQPNRPQNVPILPDYLPIMAPYYFDPSGNNFFLNQFKVHIIFSLAPYVFSLPPPHPPNGNW